MLKKLLAAFKTATAAKLQKVSIAPANTIPAGLTDKLERLERIRQEGAHIPCTVDKIISTGFYVRVKTLPALIRFRFMPWQYPHERYWHVVAHSIVGRLYFCLVHRIEEDNFILVDASVHKFTPAKFKRTHLYRGIVLDKLGDSLLVDFGYGLEWDRGSYPVVIPKSHFGNDFNLLHAEIGDVVRATYAGVNPNNGKLIFSCNAEKIQWLMGVPQKMIGDTVDAVLMKEKYKIKYCINGKYRAQLIVNPEEEAEVNKQLNAMPDGTLLRCAIVGEENHKFKIVWLDFVMPIPLPEVMPVIELEKKSECDEEYLKLVNTEVEVTIIKEPKNIHRFFIDEKYECYVNCKPSIAKYFGDFLKKLNHGDTFPCVVTKYNKKDGKFRAVPLGEVRVVGNDDFPLHEDFKKLLAQESLTEENNEKVK